MKKRISMFAWLASIGWLCACSRETPVETIDSLNFPVILVVGTSAKQTVPSQAEVIENKHALSQMRVGLYSTLSDTTLSASPIVIDSTEAVFQMRKIKGEHGGAWMMLNPNGLMPIRFDLIRAQKGGIDAARAVLENCTYLGRDLDTDRTALRQTRIRQAKNMVEVMQIVGETPPE
jgi:hypothetical protein